jgi:hypothetical protein
MSNAQHTPGPWRIGSLASYDGYTGQPYRNVWAGEDEAATVVARAIRSDGAMTNDVDADALLIAAAPELLEAAEMAFCLLDNFVEDPRVDVEIKATMVELQKAIAKAEGRDQK